MNRENGAPEVPANVARAEEAGNAREAVAPGANGTNEAGEVDERNDRNEASKANDRNERNEASERNGVSEVSEVTRDAAVPRGEAVDVAADGRKAKRRMVMPVRRMHLKMVEHKRRRVTTVLRRANPRLGVGVEAAGVVAAVGPGLTVGAAPRPSNSRLGFDILNACWADAKAL